MEKTCGACERSITVYDNGNRSRTAFTSPWTFVAHVRWDDRSQREEGCPGSGRNEWDAANA